MRRLTLGMMSVAALAFVLVGNSVAAASAVGDLDQSVSGSTANSTVVSSAQAVGQVFTAGRNGLLDRVTIDIRKEGTPGELEVSLFELSDGYPAGAALTTQVVAASAVSTTMGTVTVDFSNPASIMAGTQYAILLESPNSTSTYDMFSMQMMGGNYSWGAEVNPLSTGFAVYRSYGSWSNSTGDLRFATYVTAPEQTIEAPPALPGGAGGSAVVHGAPGVTLAHTGYSSPGVTWLGLALTLTLAGLGSTALGHALRSDRSSRRQTHDAVV